MAAPSGNQFWKLRSSHGRDTLFADSEALWKAACEYFNWCDAHPWWKNEAVKSGDSAGTIIKVPTARPYTMQGLCLYLDCNVVYFNQFEYALAKKDDDLSKGFSKIVTRIREVIYMQKFEGAAVGAFNANIIARDLGLREKTELTGPDGGPIQTESKVTQHTVVFKKFKADQNLPPDGDNPDIQRGL